MLLSQDPNLLGGPVVLVSSSRLLLGHASHPSTYESAAPAHSFSARPAPMTGKPAAFL